MIEIELSDDIDESIVRFRVDCKAAPT